MDHVDIFSEVVNSVKDNFSNLSVEQLNWKQDSKSWSIGECLNHLITSDKTYFPLFDEIIQGTYQPGFWTRNSPFSGYLGRWMVKSLGKDVSKKYKSPSAFLPSSSEIESDIVRQYENHMAELIHTTKQVLIPGREKIVIHSPAAKIITYSLTDCFGILSGHHQRHLVQALRVMNHFGFSS